MQAIKCVVVGDGYGIHFDYTNSQYDFFEFSARCYLNDLHWSIFLLVYDLKPLLIENLQLFVMFYSGFMVLKLVTSLTNGRRDRVLRTCLRLFSYIAVPVFSITQMFSAKTRI